MPRNEFRLGDYNVQCDRSGRKVKASKCRQEWNGLFVLAKYYEERQPQDFVRGRLDDQAVSLPRTEGADDFLDTNEVSASDLPSTIG